MRSIKLPNRIASGFLAAGVLAVGVTAATATFASTQGTNVSVETYQRPSAGAKIKNQPLGNVPFGYECSYTVNKSKIMKKQTGSERTGKGGKYTIALPRSASSGSCSVTVSATAHGKGLLGSTTQQVKITQHRTNTAQFVYVTNGASSPQPSASASPGAGIAPPAGRATASPNARPLNRQ